MAPRYCAKCTPAKEFGKDIKVNASNPVYCCHMHINKINPCNHAYCSFHFNEWKQEIEQTTKPKKRNRNQTIRSHQ